MRVSTIIVGCVAALSAAAPAAAYISSPLALGRPAAHLGGHAGLAPRARARSSAPSMQLNPQDKTFRRSVALRAEGDDEQKLPAGRCASVPMRCALCLALTRCCPPRGAAWTPHARHCCPQSGHLLTLRSRVCLCVCVCVCVCVFVCACVCVQPTWQRPVWQRARVLVQRGIGPARRACDASTSVLCDACAVLDAPCAGEHRQPSLLCAWRNHGLCAHRLLARAELPSQVWHTNHATHIVCQSVSAVCICACASRPTNNARLLVEVERLGALKRRDQCEVLT